LISYPAAIGRMSGTMRTRAEKISRKAPTISRKTFRRIRKVYLLSIYVLIYSNNRVGISWSMT